MRAEKFILRLWWNSLILRIRSWNFGVKSTKARRIYAKEVLISKKKMNSHSQQADGTAKLSGRDYEFGEPTQRRERTARSEDCSRELRGEPGESQPTETKKKTLKPGKTSGRFKVTSFNRHHIEPRVQLYVPKGKKCSLFHWKTLMWPGLLTKIWTSCKKNVSTITGMWTRIKVYQILGQDSQSSLSWKKNLSRDCDGVGWNCNPFFWASFKSHNYSLFWWGLQVFLRGTSLGLSKLHRISSMLWSSSIGFTAMKNTDCFSPLRLFPPVINPLLNSETMSLAFPTW